MEMTATLPTAPPTTFARAFLLRFGFAYTALFMVRVVFGAVYVFEWLDALISKALRPIAAWVAGSVFGIPGELPWENGSGDKTLDWIWVVCCVVLGAASALVWLAFDRRRAHDAKIRTALRIFLRYSIGYTLLYYGIGKLFDLQFPSPNGTRLLQPYGESSPMGLMWTFMGASPAYQFFSGAAETIGALLLLSRRTTTLGALVLGVVLVNVVMMNFCYDVPVKLNSSHYLVMCVYLMCPDIAALLRFFVRQQPAVPYVEAPPAVARRWVRVTRLVLKYGLSAVVIASDVYQCVFVYSPKAPAWYDGAWQVGAFERNGQTIPPVATDTTRWRLVRFHVSRDKSRARWGYMDGRWGDPYELVVDDKAQTMTFSHEDSDGDRKSAEPTGPAVMHYVRGDANHLTLEGKLGSDALVIQLERFEPSKSLLMGRGFHWINENPFNR